MIPLLRLLSTSPARRMLSLFVLFVSVTSVLCRPDGAPASSCKSFYPLHFNTPAQTGPSPYVIEPGVIRIAQGTRLLVTISSPQSSPFQGYIVQARNPLGAGEALGTFTNVPSTEKSIRCGAKDQDTITHSSKTNKGELEFEWEAPADYIGTVVFNGTILQDFAQFWVGVQSKAVQVVTKRSLAESSGISAGISTTRAPKQSTAPPTLRTKIDLAPKSALRDTLADGCASTKTCFGIPGNCITDGSTCSAIVTVRFTGQKYEFEMRAASSQYVAVGLSSDAKMGDDQVVECIQVATKTEIFTSYNTGYSNQRSNRSANSNGIDLVDGSFVDGTIYCKYQRDTTTTIDGRTYNLESTPYFLVLAAGPTKSGNLVGYHADNKAGTIAARYLADPGIFGSASKLLLRLHAGFMITAWIGAASIGILLARYFKQTWVGNQLCGKDQWFAWHRVFMILTWSLTIAGFVIIFVELKAWSAENNPHAILGTITTGLAFIQPFMAAFRPAPTSSRRPIFNWMHWLVGNAAHILAIVTIFFAQRLSKAELPLWVDWILVAYVAFHVIMHLVLSVLGCASEKNSVKRVNSFPMKEMNSSRNPLQMADRNQDAPHTCFRKFLLGLYIVIIVLLTVAIVLTAVLAPVESYFKYLKITM